MSLGNFGFVLHSHLPYVMSHGKWPHGMDWLNEAAAETYVPLLQAVEDLVEEEISPKFTIGITPVLCEMLSHRDFPGEFSGYLNYKIGAAGEDINTFEKRGQNVKADMAKRWIKFYESV